MADKEIHLAESNLFGDQDAVPIKAVDMEDGTHALRVEGGLVANGGVPPNVTRRLSIEGRNNAVSQGTTWVDIWEGGSDIIPEPNPLGETITVNSTSINDTIAGTGVQKVRVEYLNTLEQLTFVDIDMNGTTPVTAAGISNMTDIIDLYAIQLGSGGTSDGNIDVYLTGTPTTIYTRIVAGGNKSQSTLRHLLPSSTFYLTSMTVSTNTKSTEVALRATNNDSGDVFDKVYLYQVPLVMSDSPLQIIFNPAIVIPPNSRMKVSAKTTSPNTQVAIWIDGWVKV